MSSSTGWRRCAGVVSTATPNAARAERFLDGAQVIALIESDPDAPFSVAVAVAVDEERRVAVLSSDRTEIVPGPQLADLVQALATECRGLVVFEDIVADAERSEPGADPDDELDDPFESDIDLSSTRLPERAVTLTRAPQRDLQDLATEANTVLSVLTHGDHQVVFVQDGPALTSLQWRTEHLPVVVLERGESFPSVTVVSEPGEGHLHSWDSTVAVVPTEVGDVVGPFVRDKLGSLALVRNLLAAAPGSDEQVLTEALAADGETGLLQIVTGLGLPEVVGRFLQGDLTAAQIEGTVELDPMTVADTVRRAMDEATEEARAQARAHVEHVREVADDAREQAREQARANMEQMRRHATEASAAAYRLADPDEHPTLAWTTPAVGLVQLGGAVYALRKALDRTAGGSPAGKWWGLLAGLLGTGAAANLGLTALPWLKRWRART